MMRLHSQLQPPCQAPGIRTRCMRVVCQRRPRRQALISEIVQVACTRVRGPQLVEPGGPIQSQVMRPQEMQSTQHPP